MSIKINNFDTFDKGNNDSLFNLPGYIAGYVSPEIKNMFEKKVIRAIEIQRINFWKSDVYSCGILGLIFSGAIQTRTKLLNLDKYKCSEKDHYEIENLVNKGSWSNYDKNIDVILTLKMRFLIENCLSFDPQKRISIKKLNKILKNIDILFEKIMEDINEYLEKPHLTKK